MIKATKRRPQKPGPKPSPDSKLDIRMIRFRPRDGEEIDQHLDGAAFSPWAESKLLRIVRSGR